MPYKMMRPSPILSCTGRRCGNFSLFMIGGHESRSSLKYDPLLDEWNWLPKLPQGLPISLNVCVNYLDKAIFTFSVDGKLNIKAAVMDLINLNEAKEIPDVQDEMDLCF